MMSDLSEVRALAEEALARAEAEHERTKHGGYYSGAYTTWAVAQSSTLARAVLELSVELDAEREEHRETCREAEAQIILNERLRESLMVKNTFLEDSEMHGKIMKDRVAALTAENERLRAGLTAYRRLAQVTGTSIRWGDDSAHRAVVAWERESAERALGKGDAT